MTLVMICLLIVMGPTTIVGLVVFLLFVPLIERIVSKIQFIRHKRVKLTDRRVEIVNSMLQGVSLCFCWNPAERICAVSNRCPYFSPNMKLHLTPD